MRGCVSGSTRRWGLSRSQTAAFRKSPLHGERFLTLRCPPLLRQVFSSTAEENPTISSPGRWPCLRSRKLLTRLYWRRPWLMCKRSFSMDCILIRSGVPWLTALHIGVAVSRRQHRTHSAFSSSSGKSRHWRLSRRQSLDLQKVLPGSKRLQS